MHRFGRVYDDIARNRLAPRARQMRLEPTPSEEALWRALRRNALGIRFRRQVVPGPCIADFFAPSARLVVEVDGGIHAARRDSDRVRDDGLRAMGLRVLRLDARLVEEHIQVALRLVCEALVMP